MHEPVFGPDTSDGLFMNPVVLIYYVSFFVFGVFLYQRGIQISRWWTLALLPTLTVVLFGGLTLLYDVKEDWAKPLADVFQVAFAWLMCFGLIGLFRLVAAQERYWVRYLSDASYWLYLWHLALIVIAFELLVDWQVSVHLKFTGMVVGVTVILLVVYQFGIRYTPIGTMLNGKRTRSRSAASVG